MVSFQLDLIESVKKMDNDAFEKLWNLSKPIVRSIINKFKRFAYKLGVSYDELEQECYICLYEFCLSFDDRKIKPEVIFYICCKNALIKYLWQIKNRTSKAYRKNYTIPQIQSLDETHFDDESCDFYNIIPDESSTDDFNAVVDAIDNAILRKDLIQVLYDVFCNSITSEIIKKLYGIELEQCSIESISKQYGLSSFEIFSIESKAFQTIRTHPRSKWFVQKYAPQCCDEKLEKIDNVSDASLYVQLNETVDDMIYKILRG